MQLPFVIVESNINTIFALIIPVYCGKSKNMDFSKFLNKNILCNFHSHTQFCDGRDKMEDFVINAIESGFTDYGFSPHSPVPFYSSCNMTKDNVNLYLSEFRRLKDLYGNKINLYAAMEVDYLGDSWGPAIKYFSDLNLDYKIGSVHFIPYDNSTYVDIDGHFENFKIKMAKYFNNDILHVVESYYSQSMKMVETGGFDIIGHFDKIGHNASDFAPGIETEDWYQKLVFNLFESIMDNKLIIEINTKAWQDYHRFFPNERYFNWLKKYNAPVLFNSDCHYKNKINDGRSEAISLYLDK